MNDRLTICIPSFNRKDHLKRTLRDMLSEVEHVSCVEEVIFVDDGYDSDSRDNILACFEEYDKFRYQRTKTSGSFGHVFLECIRASKTNHVLITYDDDILFTKNLQKLHTICKRNNDHSIFVPVWLSTSNKSLRGSPKKTHSIHERDILRFMAHAPGICYKKSAINDNLTEALMQRLEFRCAFSEMYPQVVLASLLADRRGKILATPIPIGKDGAALPTEIKTINGDSYFTLRARLHQYLALLDMDDSKVLGNPIITHLRTNFLARILLQHTDLIIMRTVRFYVGRRILTSFRTLKHRLKCLIIGSR